MYSSVVLSFDAVGSYHVAMSQLLVEHLDTNWLLLLKVNN